MEVLNDGVVQAWLNDGNGNGNGKGNGFGNGNGFGKGYGFGDGKGFGKGYGKGNGNGNGDGFGNGNGNGDDDGFGIFEFDGTKIYVIDGIPTAILSIHGNIAKGFILDLNVINKPCYIVKGNGQFAHGETLHAAYTALQEKIYDNSTEEERIAAFLAKFPKYDVPYSNDDLFTYHHILTGSCRMGRQQFCQNKGISLNDKTTVSQFIELTKDSYGGEIIAKLSQYYK